MANQIAPTDEPRYTERWSIPFCHVPEIIGNCEYSDEVPGSKAREYGRVLDTVYEMADQIATANGTKIEDAIDYVCRTERWNVIPKHRRLLALIWNQPEGYVRIEAKINAKRLYLINTQRGERKFHIEVSAFSRRAAVRIAHDNGYRVNDINTVG